MNSNECCFGIEKLLEPEVFKALSDPNRVAILAKLSQGSPDQSVAEVATCCPIDLSVVSRHLKILKDAGVVEAHKQGKSVLYRLRTTEIVTMLRNIADALEACCPKGMCETVGGLDE